ncbi:hypothetical protein PTTG_10236 [Puccinia triticina 1-1 BBBD Race 1]|uniref:Uncharacterized protein n=1 Tax=Puccinia triticina (isolate 1-1 / race 1 (BBBD)) TaxID=630390 RepID=A0A180G910_PUCT1|nr:hypothetical protein PTTG_10236 [Puccinia triticina 1-1 BBBD Race 1]
MTTTPRNGRINLQRFWTSDGPMFTGPFQDTKVFLTWIHGLEIFFDTKAVTQGSDKIQISRTLIKETNLLSFYSNKAAKESKGQLRSLWMAENKNFIQFESRARTLQRMVNFGANPLVVTDEELADWIVLGLLAEMRGQVHIFELLGADPFDYDQNSPRPRDNRTTCKHGHSQDYGGQIQWRIQVGVPLANPHIPRLRRPLPLLQAPLWHNAGQLPRSNGLHARQHPCRLQAATEAHCLHETSGLEQPSRTRTRRASQQWTRTTHGNTSRRSGVAEGDGWEEDNDDLFPHLDLTSATALQDIDARISYTADKTEALITKETKAAAVQEFTDSAPYLNPALKARITAILGPSLDELAGAYGVAYTQCKFLGPK